MILPQDPGFGNEFGQKGRGWLWQPRERPPVPGRAALSTAVWSMLGYAWSTCSLKDSIISSIGSANAWMLVQ